MVRILMFMIWILRSKRSFLFLTAIGLLLALLGMTVITALAAMTPVSFTATPGNGQVLVAWETDTEVDNAGFFVYRGINQKRSFLAVGPIIASTVGTRTPTATDPTNVGTATPTPTPTPPSTPAATQTGAYPGPVQSPSPGTIQSPTPTQLQTPSTGPATSTPISLTQTPGTDTTSVNLSSQAGNPTSTLRPFPSVTYEFPDASQTSVVSIQSTPQPGDNSLSGWINVARLGPLTLILLVWVLLGGWFYLTLRRME